jgi:diadenosine tetraphosphate (Ap4A) HIT family hydrolase
MSWNHVCRKMDCESSSCRTVACRMQLMSNELFVVIKDKFPKARLHILIISRAEELLDLSCLRRCHLQLLCQMGEIGQQWAMQVCPAAVSEVCIPSYECLSHSVFHLTIVATRRLGRTGVLTQSAATSPPNRRRLVSRWGSIGSPRCNSCTCMSLAETSPGQA